MYQYNADTEALQERNIVYCAMEIGMIHRGTAERDDERPTSMGMDVRRGLPKKIYVVVCVHDWIISNTEA
mgnify:CR=1 FL=1|jgi:hypothetical protein